MTQVFADDFQATMPLSPALMPGKGVRPVTCVGCRQDTLPRPDDGAPLCQRCSDRLASDGASARWFRRRSLL